jgi:hypothetical protein
MSERKSIPRRVAVASDLGEGDENGRKRSSYGAHGPITVVMESDRDSTVGRSRNPVESRINPERLHRFREAYLSNGLNAVRAARYIGMRPKTAKANAHRLARALKLEMQEALHAIGMDSVTSLHHNIMNLYSYCHLRRT